MCITAENHKRKPQFWAFKVIDGNTAKKLVTSACYNKQDVWAICNRFHAGRVEVTKCGLFRGYLFSCPCSKGTPLLKGTNFFHEKLVLVAAHSKDYVILACTVLQTYRWTNTSTMAKTCEALCFLLRQTTQAVDDIWELNIYHTLALGGESYFYDKPRLMLYQRQLTNTETQKKS